LKDRDVLVGGYTCLRDCDNFVVVTVPGSFEILWQLGSLATSCLADYNRHGVVLNGVKESILVTSYWQQRAGLVESRNERVCIRHLVLSILVLSGSEVLRSSKAVDAQRGRRDCQRVLPGDLWPCNRLLVQTNKHPYTEET
jgi:hypothetical protein